MPTLKTRSSLLNAPDYADRVNLIKKIKVNNAWRFAPVVPEANGRLKDRVRVNDTIEIHLKVRTTSNGASAANAAASQSPVRMRWKKPAARPSSFGRFGTVSSLPLNQSQKL